MRRPRSGRRSVGSAGGAALGRPVDIWTMEKKKNKEAISIICRLRQHQEQGQHHHHTALFERRQPDWLNGRMGWMEWRDTTKTKSFSPSVSDGRFIWHPQTAIWGWWMRTSRGNGPSVLLLLLWLLEREEESLLFIHVICQRWPFKNCHLSLALEMKCQFQNDYIGNSLETECPRGAAHRHCHRVTGVVPGMTENHLDGSKGWQNMMCIVIGWVGYDLSVIMYTVNCDFLSYFPWKWR